MSLLEQPEDVLKLQLYELDALSLLKACRASKVAAKICQDDYFWLSKLQKDFPGTTSPTDITQARNLYLNAAIFNGEIYKNGELKYSGVLLYDSLSKWVEPTDIVFYSRPDWEDKLVDDLFTFDILSVSWSSNPRALTIGRPTQIDIVSISNIHTFYMTNVWVINYKEMLPTLIPEQNYVFQVAELFGDKYSTMVPASRLAVDLVQFTQNINNILSGLHRTNNSPAYQRYLDYMDQSSITALMHPSVLNDGLEQPQDISQRKTNLLQQLTRQLPHQIIRTGYKSADEFVEAQTVAVNALTDEELVAIEYTMRVLKNARLSSESNKERYLGSIYFTRDGSLRIDIN